MRDQPDPYPHWIEWGMLILNFSLYVFGHHFEGLISTHPMKNPRNTIVFAFFILSSTLYIFNLADFQELADMTLNYTFTTTFAIYLSLLAVGVSYLTFRRSRKISSLLEFLALLFILGGSIFYHLYFAGIFYFGDLRAHTDLVLSLGASFCITGIFFYFINFLKYSHIYRLPNPIFYVMIYSDVGIPLYIRKISKIQTTFNDVELLPALFSAIDAFIRETLGAREALNYIDGDAFEILFSPFLNDHVIFALITTHGSYYLEKSIQAFVKNFPLQLFDNLNIHAVGSRFNTTVDSLLKTHLSFLDIEPDQSHE